jgi:aminotransferase
VTRIRTAGRVTSFADSVFAEMTRLARLHNAVNLSQGFPDFEAPQAIKDAACTAIQAEQNQYAPPYGTAALRQAIAGYVTRRYGVPVSADDQVTVCCGSTEAMMAVMLSSIDPGDQVIVFERSSPAPSRSTSGCTRPTGGSIRTSWRGPSPTARARS